VINEENGERRIVGVRTNRGTFGCRWVVNAAGLYSDDVMHCAGVRPEFKITARRGEYCVLDRADIVIDNVLFPYHPAQGRASWWRPRCMATLSLAQCPSVEKSDHSVTTEGVEELYNGAHRWCLPEYAIGHLHFRRAARHRQCAMRDTWRQLYL
jgi:glycerol-3-phosphate dehydrogenase